jgi:hypothetical protein
MPDLDDDLDDFAPRGAGQGAPAQAGVASQLRRSVDAVSHFPSRDPLQVEQLDLNGLALVLNRFRAMCKADRRAYYDMLEILMDSSEAQQRR